jgi:NADPH:quinone reductase-like Zn-dependent oxidoreductase
LTGLPEDGAFNHYTRVPSRNAAILPDHISYTEGCVLPTAVDTAARGLYGQDFMDLALPTAANPPNRKDKVVVVYGGSSSVGLAAVQLAVNGGYRVIATASPKNFDLVRQGGADEVFDYKSPTLADDVVKAVGDNKFQGLYNAIGIPESFEIVTPLMEKLGGGFVANTKPPGKLPESIRAAFTLGIGEYAFPIWEDFVGPALAEGKLKALPPPKVVGKGLESLQDAFAIREGDVSGVKIVVEL